MYQSQRSTCPIDLGDVDRSDIDPLSNPLVQRIIGESVLEITELLDQFMVSFRESIPSAPYSLRWFCKQLFDLSKEFFPEREGTYFISGFIMLRLVCPILITPNVFFGVDPHQIPISARRSLLIVSERQETLLVPKEVNTQHHI